MAREERSSLALVEDKEMHARMHTRALALVHSQVIGDSDCALASNESNTGFTQHFLSVNCVMIYMSGGESV